LDEWQQSVTLWSFVIKILTDSYTAMKLICSHIILRFCLTLALVLQSLLPASLTIAAQAGYDVSNFICTPSKLTPSTKAQAHVKELLILLGENGPHEPNPSEKEHCSNCVISFNTIEPTPLIYLTPTAFSAQAPLYIFKLNRLVALARGPPLGGRAPPKFL